MKNNYIYIVLIFFGTIQSALGSGLFGLAGIDTADPVNGYEYNAFIIGDHTTDSGDCEGRLVVGGNATYTASYSVGQAGGGVGHQNVQSDGTRDDLIVGGNFSKSGIALSVNYGNTQIGGTVSGGGVTTLGNNTVEQEVASMPVDFDSAAAKMKDLSSSLSSLTSTHSMLDEGWGKLTYDGSGEGDLAVFNIDVSLWADGANQHYFEYDEGDTLLINLFSSKGTTIDLTYDTFYINGTLAGGDGTYDLGAEDLLFNLVGIDTLNMNGVGLSGSLLAPDTDLFLNGGGINGQVVVASADQTGGGEFHNFELNGSTLTDVVPEPMVISLIGLFGMATIGIRRIVCV